MERIPKISFHDDVTKAGFEMLSLAKLTSLVLPNDHDPFSPHKIDFSALLIITSGEVKHTVDFKKYTVAENECLIISRNQIHAFDRSSKYTGYIILFTQDFQVNFFSRSTYNTVSGLLNYHIFEPKYRLTEELFNEIDSLLCEIDRANLLLKSELIAARLSILLLKLSYHNENEFVSADVAGYSMFERYRQMVETGYSRSRNVIDYALRLNVSYKHLNELCKRITHRTAKEFLDEYVILEVKRKLCATTLSVKEILYETGFDEPTNFHKYFKNLTGTTPAEFRLKYK